MANDFRLQCIRISISALSKYDRIKNIKENKRGERIFVPSGVQTRYKCAPCHVRVAPHICTGP
jgi:hypothetical protein